MPEATEQAPLRLEERGLYGKGLPGRGGHNGSVASVSFHNWLRARLHYALAHALSFGGRHAAAIAQYRRALEYEPGYAQAWRNIGFLLAQTTDSSGAVDALGRALALDPGHDATRFNLAFVLHEAGRYEDAIADFERVVASAPKHDRAWYGLGLCLKQSGRLEEATKALQEAARLQYFNPHAAYELAIAYHRLGRHEALQAEYERVKGFDPTYADRIRRETGI
jgi:tetratricopeptide (TPR) repeat protein